MFFSKETFVSKHNSNLWILQHSVAPYCTFVKVCCRDRMLYLYRKPSAIYAVFWACWCITLAPVKLHLLSLKTAWQSSTSYKVVILQENSNWRQRRVKKKLWSNKEGKLSALIWLLQNWDYLLKKVDSMGAQSQRLHLFYSILIILKITT